MTSRNINIEISIYERLRKLRREDESFSEVLERLMAISGKNLSGSFGVLKNEPLDYSEIKKSRRDRNVVL
ncbi:antitoxin [Candidatus Micrarchaeota archaeon]|nr:antitoxin [Candidatus Micrarchaeota archaeon]